MVREEIKETGRREDEKRVRVREGKREGVIREEREMIVPGSALPSSS